MLSISLHKQCVPIWIKSWPRLGLGRSHKQTDSQTRRQFVFSCYVSCCGHHHYHHHHQGKKWTCTWSWQVVRLREQKGDPLSTVFAPSSNSVENSLLPAGLNSECVHVHLHLHQKCVECALWRQWGRYISAAVVSPEVFEALLAIIITTSTHRHYHWTAHTFKERIFNSISLLQFGRWSCEERKQEKEESQSAFLPESMVDSLAFFFSFSFLW